MCFGWFPSDVRFQSTLPHGSDLRQDIDVLTVFYFNPRSLTGATYKVTHFMHNRVISIHAPSRERPGSISAAFFNLVYFNPRSLTGATYIPSSSITASLNFNPRSLTGATGGVVNGYNFVVYFNPRSLTGATLKYIKPIGIVGFQSTLPHGSDQHC